MQSQWTTATLFMLGAALLTSELAGQAVFVPDSRADVGSCSTIESERAIRWDRERVC